MVKETRVRTEKVYVTLLAVLVAIQPILELVWFNNGTIGEVAGFTVPTLIRFGLIGVAGILSFFVIRFNRKYLWLVGYLAVVAVYAVLHHIFCIDFHSLVPGDFDYNMVSEMFYLIRMMVPIAMIYLIYNSSFSRKLFERIVIWISLFSSGLVFITNLTKISIGSYSDRTILGNIIDWFVNKGVYTFNDLASKGFFYWSIYSTVLVLILPYLVYLFLREKKIRYFLLLMLQCTALYMFGTKATTFSVIIVLAVMFAVYLVCTLIKKDEKLVPGKAIPFAALLLAAILVYPYTPAISRSNYDAEYQKELDADYDEEEETKAMEEADNLEEYFDENYMYFSVSEDLILRGYSYKYDLEFWDDLLSELGPSQRMQNRIVEERILERVKEINDDPMDDYFGLGYTRTSSIFNLERDFLYQYYSLGIIGVILFLGPYVGILIVIMALMLIKFKKRGNILNCSLVLGVGLSLFLAYYSGNVMDNLGITIVMGFVLGILLKINFKKNEDDTCPAEECVKEQQN